MKKVLIVIAAFLSVASIAAASPTPTAKLVGQDRVTDIGGSPVDMHFVYQDVKDGDANGLENQLNSDCTGDNGSISIQINTGKPTKYDVLCAHYVLADAGTHLTMNFAYQSGANEWKLIRWLGTKNGLFTTDSQLCAIRATNMGPDTAKAVCAGHITRTYYRSNGSAHVIVN